MKKKLIIPIMIATMLGSSIPAFGANFSDINDVPWDGAKTYINKVADLGLMVGSKDSSGKMVFKAKNNLSYLECSQLVYAIFKDNAKMTSYSDTVKSKWQSVLKGYKISDWAWPAVAFCLENNIVTIPDVSGFMNGSTSKNAARQDVAVMFGKAMEKAGYTQASAYSFNDASKIASSAIKYANLLGSLEILTGDQNKNFNPTNLINRAEMSVIVSKVFDKLQTGGTTTTTPSTPSTSTSGTLQGIVSSVVTYGDNYLLTMLSSAGQKSYMVSKNTKVSYDGKTYSVSDIGESDTITVAYNGSTVISIVINKDANGDIGSSSSSTTTTAASTVSGTIYSMTSSKMVVQKGSSSSSRETFSDFDDDMEVYIDGRSRSYRKLLDAYDDLKSNDDPISVVVSLDKKENVIKIVATVEATEVDGTIKSASTTKVKIGSKNYEFNEDEDLVTIKINGTEVTIKKFVDLYDEYGDFEAEAKLDGEDKIISLTVTSKKYKGEGLSGEVDDISATRVKIDGKWYYFPSRESDMDRVRLNGKNSTLEKIIDAYDDLGRNETMTAEITLDKDDEVVEIYAKTDDDAKVLSATITSRYINNRYIEIKDTDYSVDSDDVTVDVDNGNKTIKDYDDLVDFIEDAGATVELEVTVSGSRATKISGYVTKLTDVEIASVSSRNDTITIYVGRKEYTYDLNSSCDITLDRDDVDLDDIGDELPDYTILTDLELNSRGKVTSIDADYE